MERKINGGAYSIMAAVLVVYFMLANNGVVGQERMYSCWGGCYNGCFAKTQTERLACDFQCLTSCVPRTASDFMYYCEIGCSIKRCIPVAYDGARMEGCFGWCTNLCKRLIAP